MITEKLKTHAEASQRCFQKHSGSIIRESFCFKSVVIVPDQNSVTDPNNQQLYVTFVSEGLSSVSVPSAHMLSCNINKPKLFSSNSPVKSLKAQQYRDTASSPVNETYGRLHPGPVWCPGLKE